MKESRAQELVILGGNVSRFSSALSNLSAYQQTQQNALGRLAPRWLKHVRTCHIFSPRLYIPEGSNHTNSQYRIFQSKNFTIFRLFFLTLLHNLPPLPCNSALCIYKVSHQLYDRLTQKLFLPYVFRIFACVVRGDQER